jgi:hypothetical protein
MDHDALVRLLSERVTSLEQTVSVYAARLELFRRLAEENREQLAMATRAEEILRRAGEPPSRPQPVVRVSHARPRPPRDRHGMHVVRAAMVPALAGILHLAARHKAATAAAVMAAAVLTAAIPARGLYLPVYAGGGSGAAVHHHRPRVRASSKPALPPRRRKSAVTRRAAQDGGASPVPSQTPVQIDPPTSPSPAPAPLPTDVVPLPTPTVDPGSTLPVPLPSAQVPLGPAD